MRIYTAITASAVLLQSFGLVACAGAPPPTDQMAAAEAEARAAQAVGAENIPQADLQYRLATEQLAKGRSLMKDDENEAAARMFQRARADADLALELARRDAARSEAANAGQMPGATHRNPAGTMGQTPGSSEGPPPAAAPSPSPSTPTTP